MSSNFFFFFWLVSNDLCCSIKYQAPGSGTRHYSLGLRAVLPVASIGKTQPEAATKSSGQQRPDCQAQNRAGKGEELMEWGWGGVDKHRISYSHLPCRASLWASGNCHRCHLWNVC